MAYTAKERAYQKKRYRTDKKYREKLIKDNTEKHKKHKKKYAKKMRAYNQRNKKKKSK